MYFKMLLFTWLMTSIKKFMKLKTKEHQKILHVVVNINLMWWHNQKITKQIIKISFIIYFLIIIYLKVSL